MAGVPPHLISGNTAFLTALVGKQDQRKGTLNTLCIVVVRAGLEDHDAIAADIDRFIEQLAAKAARRSTLPAAGL